MSSELGGHVRRFFRGFRWGLTPDEVKIARLLLRPDQLLFFTALQGRERRHAMDIVHYLREDGDPPTELLVAALLHNVGKGSLHLHERVAYALLESFAPGLLRLVANADGVGFQRAMTAQIEHPERGAQLVAGLGAGPRVQELIRRHHDSSPGDDEELALFMRADVAC